MVAARGGLRLEDEVLLAQLWLLNHDRGAFDRVLQFPHVAHPRLLLQLVHGRGRNAGYVLVHGEGEFTHEMFDQWGQPVIGVADRLAGTRFRVVPSRAT